MPTFLPFHFAEDLQPTLLTLLGASPQWAFGSGSLHVPSPPHTHQGQGRDFKTSLLPVRIMPQTSHFRRQLDIVFVLNNQPCSVTPAPSKLNEFMPQRRAVLPPKALNPKTLGSGPKIKFTFLKGIQLQHFAKYTASQRVSCVSED